MFYVYVYVLRSKTDLGCYIGFSTNLRLRLKQHADGKSLATARRGPWKLISYEAYLEQADALGRERYLKSGAGRTRRDVVAAGYWLSVNARGRKRRTLNAER